MSPFFVVAAFVIGMMFGAAHRVPDCLTLKSGQQMTIEPDGRTTVSEVAEHAREAPQKPEIPPAPEAP